MPKTVDDLLLWCVYNITIDDLITIIKNLWQVGTLQKTRLKKVFNSTRRQEIIIEGRIPYI